MGQKTELPIWIRTVVILLVIAGIFFRFYHLDRKVYWIDEVNTSLRSLGYTRTELIQSLFTGEVVSVADLQKFQQPNSAKTWTDTYSALSNSAEHTPLYFILTRLWIEHFGAKIHAIRLFSAILSLFIFPSLFLFCRQLFYPDSPGNILIPWLSIALLAVSPVQVLYAQEARPYALLMVMTLLASAVLLKAMRTHSLMGWILYSLSLAIGLYTQLLFGLVAIAHGIYVFFGHPATGHPGTRHSGHPGSLGTGHSGSLGTGHSETGHPGHPGIEHPATGHPETGYLGKGRHAYAWATLAGCLPLIPWIGLLIKNWASVQATTASLSEVNSLSSLLNQWLLNMSRVLVDRELGAANLLSAGLAMSALYVLGRHTPKRVWLMILALVGVNFLALALPDLILGGERSTRLRYLFPAYLGIQVAIAHLFAVKAFQSHNWQRKLWQILFVVLIGGGILGCVVNSQPYVWWNKSVPRSAYYLPVSQIIQQHVQQSDQNGHQKDGESNSQPLIISDGRASDILAFSYWLNSDVKLQLLTDPSKLKVAPGFDRMFLLNPSRRLRQILQRRGYEMRLIYRDEHVREEIGDRLWQLKSK